MHTIRPAALLAVLIAAPAVAGAATTALQCGDVYDSKSARLVGARTIVVTDGRIAQVLRERANVAGAETVDLAGHTCMPGWIDLHVHLSGESNPDSYSERFRLYHPIRVPLGRLRREDSARGFHDGARPGRTCLDRRA